MTDYTNYGLDSFLRPVNSPGNDSRSVSGIDFDVYNDRNIITSAKVKDFNFSSGFGGTLVLGGTTNGNGYAEIKNNAGSTIVTIDNNGITVTGGSISITNSSGTEVIDALGVNSVNNFYNDSASGGVFDSSTDSPVNITSGSLSSFVLPRATECYIYMTGNGQNYKVGENCYTYTYDSYLGGTITNFTCNFNGQYDGTAYFNQLFYLGRIFLLAAGTHQLNMQIYRSSGTAHLAGWELGLIQLGR